MVPIKLKCVYNNYPEYLYFDNIRSKVELCIKDN